MATVASRLLRAARKASLASRAAAAAASRAAAMASRSARAADAAAAAARLGSGAIGSVNNNCPTSGSALFKPSQSNHFYYCADYKHLPDDAKTPADKDFESDEAVWALYERWRKAFDKERDHAEMARRFKLFRLSAEMVHHWNTYLPDDPEEAAIYIQKRKEAKLLLSKGEDDVSSFEDWHLPMELGPFADGEEPFLSESSKRLLKSLEDKDSFSVAAE